jgi:hypothetical protein
MSERFGETIRITGDRPPDWDLIQRRMQETKTAMDDALYGRMFSDVPIAPRRITWREHVCRKWERVHDAWLVLTGRADIGY